MFRHRFVSKEQYFAYGCLWLACTSISFYGLYGSALDSGGLARPFAAAALGVVMLEAMIALITLASKTIYAALAFLWLVFASLGFYAFYGSPIDPGGMERLFIAAALGGGLLGGMIVFFVLSYLVTDWLPSKIAYWRLSPIDRYAHDVNAITKRGRQARNELMARLLTEAVSPSSRQKIYYDPENDQHWLGNHWDADFWSGEDLTPISRSKMKEVLALFKAGENADRLGLRSE